MAHGDDPLSILRKTFGFPTREPVEEGGTTAVVLVTPSSVTKAQAVDAAKRFELRGVLRDIGAVSARALADELEASGLRPADYAGFEEVSKIVQERVVRELLGKPEEFTKVLNEFLRMRG